MKALIKLSRKFAVSKGSALVATAVAKLSPSAFLFASQESKILAVELARLVFFVPLSANEKAENDLEYFN